MAKFMCKEVAILYVVGANEILNLENEKNYCVFWRLLFWGVY